jgi:LemA protein
MVILEILLLVLAFVAAVWCYMVFNHLVMLKHNVAKAWANVDVLLRQRHDELPKLVAACARYLQHERALIERVVATRGALAAAREREDTRALGPLERELGVDLARLVALAEAHPELKADDMFLHLQRRIAELEAAIADRREFFNATVTVNNVEIRQFPYLLFARAFGLRSFHVFAAERAAGVAARAAGTGR